MMDFDTKLHVKIRLLSASHSFDWEIHGRKRHYHFFDAIRVDSVLDRRDQDVPRGKAQPCEHTLRLASDGLCFGAESTANSTSYSFEWEFCR